MHTFSGRGSRHGGPSRQDQAQHLGHSLSGSTNDPNYTFQDRGRHASRGIIGPRARRGHPHQHFPIASSSLAPPMPPTGPPHESHPVPLPVPPPVPPPVQPPPPVQGIPRAVSLNTH
jgi:hypothetical protein